MSVKQEFAEIKEKPVYILNLIDAQVDKLFSRVSVLWSRAGDCFPHLIWFTFEGPDSAYLRIRLDRAKDSVEWGAPHVMAKTRGLPDSAIRWAVAFVQNNKELVCSTPSDEEVVDEFH